MIADRSQPQTATLPVRDASDLAVVRRWVRNLGEQQGLEVALVEALATAVTEIGRNILDHTIGGVVTLSAVDDGRRKGVAVTFVDRGPGIPDLALAMRDGYSTGNGLGAGLPGAQRLVHDFAISSDSTSGTVITLRQWNRGRS